MHPLVAEAMKKAEIAWITTDTRPAYPVWCLWIDDALYLVSGGDEQPAPGLASATVAIVSARGDHGGRIVAWTASVSVVSPEGGTWADITTQLAGKRLNASGTSQALIDRWAAQSVVIRLVPVDDRVNAVATGSGAAVPRSTPATPRTAKPFRLHRVKRH